MPRLIVYVEDVEFFHRCFGVWVRIERQLLAHIHDDDFNPLPLVEERRNMADRMARNITSIFDPGVE